MKHIKKFKFLITFIILLTVGNISFAKDKPLKYLNSSLNEKSIAILVFPGFELLDVFGPLEMFSSIPEQKLKIILIGTESGLIKSYQGTEIKVDYNTDNAPPTDFIMIPGGQGIREEVKNEKLLEWIKKRTRSSQYVLSVCTGSALLARSGVLNHIKATSNKSVFDWVKTQGKDVIWIKKARWTYDGKFITSSGVSAGIDMSLFFINLMYGKEILKEVESYTEYSFNPKFNKF